MKNATTGAACVALTVAFAAGATGANAASRSTIPGSQPSWATSKALKSAAPSSDVVHARVYLPMRNQAALDTFTSAVSTPGSASYGQYLTPQQFDSQYAPAQSDVSAVQNWLRNAGFTVVNTPDSGRYVAVEGTVAQANAVFATTLGEYSAYGQTLRAPETAPSVPAELAGKVSAVLGLDDSAKLITSNNDNGNGPKQNHGAPGVGFRVGTPCADWYGQSSVTTTDFKVYDDKSTPLAPCGYTPAQVRGLYGLDSSATGEGQTVAFVGANASPTLVQDVTEYSKRHGLPAPSIQQIVPPGVYKHPDSPQQIPGDYYGEETLDAESIHTTAPNATLLYVGSSNAYQDFDVSINHIVDKGLASIISISYGFGGEGVPQGYINSLNGTFQQAVAEGIGVFVSSGDSGDEKAATGTAQPDFYANSPFVTAVGGTSAAIVPSGTTVQGTSAIDTASNWKRSFEVGWQTGLDSISSPTGITPTTQHSPTGYTLDGTLASTLPGGFQAGGGGGVSRVFAQPWYQQGVSGTVSTGRNVPDISALADPNTGFLVGQTQQFSDGTYYDEYRLGGTSLAAPLMAGMAADANQLSHAAGGGALGFLNPRIYGVYKSSASTALYDVDQQDTFCGGQTCSPTSKTSKLPALIRVNFANSEDATGGLTYSVRTEETTTTTLHSAKGYDTATGVGTPNGTAFLDHLVAGK